MKEIIIGLLLMGSSAVATPDKAAEILKASDIARGGVQSGLTWKAKIQTIEDGETSEREFLIKAKDHDALAEALAPARTKGEIFLFNDRNMWFYKTGLKPVSISPRQKMSGQAANGDIASTHYARDYTATLEKTLKRGSETVYVLMLKAKANNLTYDQIRYYINAKNNLAEKAEFLTLQGKIFKVGTMEYKNTITYEGKVLPFVSQLTIEDAKFTNNKSIIIYTDPKLANHSDSIFNINNLSR